MVCATINIDTTKHLNIIIFLGIVEFPQIIVELCIILDHIDIITDLYTIMNTNIVAALDIIADINPIIHLDITMDLDIIVCINIVAHLGLMRQEHTDTDPIVLVQNITVTDSIGVVFWGCSLVGRVLRLMTFSSDILLYTDSAGTTRPGKFYICKNCQYKFLRRADLKKPPQYCSTDCFKQATRNKAILSCYTCAKTFERNVSALKKSKYQIYFCSRKCKEYSQSIASGHNIITPRHYDTDKRRYRDMAFRNLPNKCCDCGIEALYLLIVHHIDGDRDNNELSNLEIVCHNHHAIRHLKRHEDVWIFSTYALTPREFIPALIAPEGEKAYATI